MNVITVTISNHCSFIVSVSASTTRVA